MGSNESASPVLADQVEGILSIRLNRPEKKNALNLAMYAALTNALERADQDDAIRVILLTGSDSCFTSGNDLADFLALPATGEESPAIRFLRAISSARKPVVAAVSGLAVGIGVTMLLHCDLVLAAEDARFQMPFVNLALCPEAGSSLLLPRVMGHQRAAELLLLGEPFGAAVAREVGIVNRVCPDGDLQATARSLAKQLAAQPAAAVRLAKFLLKRDLAAPVQETIGVELGYFMERLKTPEAAEALQAFMERRQPDFSRFP